MRARHGGFWRTGVIAAAFGMLALFTRAAYGWDSATHRLITRLAVDALPSSPLKTTLAENEPALERFSVEPDTVLKREYGRAEARRHYINLEWFGTDPFAALNSDIRKMRDRFSDRTLRRSGTLPWTIEEVAAALPPAWQSRDCQTVLRMSGYLAHYVGDASQPLHTTIHFDGRRRDRGIHQRLERAVDESVGTLGTQAGSEVRIEQINDVWTAAIGEIRDANRLVAEVIRDDRAARDEGAFGGYEYQRTILREDGGLLARQLARAASVLGSIWLYEWRKAGSPAVCEGRPFAGGR